MQEIITDIAASMTAAEARARLDAAAKKWICPDPKMQNKNSIAEYGFTQQKVFGRVDEPAENYDKMKTIITSLNDEGQENRNDLIRLLSTLLSTTESVKSRKQILEDEFKIPMTKQIDEEVLEMCNLGMAVQLKGRAEGRAEGKAEGIEMTIINNLKSLMETLQLTAKQAMNALKIPESEQPHYEALL